MNKEYTDIDRKNDFNFFLTHYNEFYEMFKNAINNPNLLKEINKVSKEYLNTLSWQNTGKECVEILKNLK